MALAGVTPEVYLRENVACMPLPSVDKAPNFGFGFETQRIKLLPEIQNRGIRVSTKILMPSKKFTKNRCIETNLDCPVSITEQPTNTRNETVTVKACFISRW